MDIRKNVFVTGTDTGVGKTVVSTVLLHALRARGLRAVGMKPVASGCTLTPEGWRNDDALALMAASAGAPRYEQVNPFALPDPTAPQIAARRAGVRVTLPPLLAAHEQLSAQADCLLVEGAGGWLAPLADDIDQGELARALGITEVVLVVGLRLGCINHARLSERAIVADGFVLKGWVANSPCVEDDIGDEYFDTLAAQMQSRCLGRLPFAPNALPDTLVGHLSFGEK